jgi:hypothetical protein
MKTAWFGTDGREGARDIGAKWARILERTVGDHEGCGLSYERLLRPETNPILFQTRTQMPYSNLQVYYSLAS